MKKTILTLLAAGAIAGAAAAPAAAQSPVKACAMTDDPVIQSVSTKPGACQSSLAKVGYDALAEGAFPSNAAAIGNCKTLEATMFQAYTPEDGRAYPYQFYNFLPLPPELQAQLYAKNRADCVRVLRFVHGGGLGGGPA